MSQIISRPNVAFSATQTYGYDGLNRLTATGESGSWSENEGYDNFGNRWLSAHPGLPSPTGETPQASTWFNSKNQINSWTYDSAGNVSSVGAMQRTFTYDAENRQLSAAINGTPTEYTYDGDGHRVTRTLSGGAPTTYVYDAMGRLEAEYGGAASGSGTTYLTQDHLGSTRLAISAAGTNCYDYFPFGGDIAAGINGRPSCYPANPDPADGLSVKFTSKERDSETGLDYFGARYFSSAQGRFTSADEPFADQHPDEPQSWNLYTYGRNNPLAYIDPSGQYVCGKSVSTDQCDSFQKSLDQSQTAANGLKDKYGADSSEYKQAQAAISAYGGRGDANGVTINVGDTGKYGAITTVANTAGSITDQNKNGQNINVTFNAALLSPDSSVPALVAHEGSHVADASAYVSSGFSPMVDPSNRQTETRAYQIQANIGIGLGWMYQTVSFSGHSPYMLQFRGWPQINTDNMINGILTQQYTNLDKAAFPHGVVKVTK